ncbi:MAG: HRDC domain-containing protein, partial [Caldilineaceae bacterium]|nr:HRDC domain-containing protein [Caldilineaceae bacterium]
RAQNILKWRHEQLSTYGIGQEYSDSAWKYLVTQFIQQGLLNRDLNTGSLGVTEAGWRVMRGEQVMGHLQEERYARAGGDDTPLAYEIALFSALRAQRKELADAENVPPYVIFADRSLQEMATYLPHSPESFATIHGVGQAKVARFADSFLPIIIEYCREHDLEERPKQGSKPKIVRVGSMKTRAEEVGELFDEGQSLNAIAEHFSVKRQTVISNLAKYVDGGNVVDSERLRTESTLPAAQLEQMLAAFDELGASALRPIFEAMGGQVEYDEIHLGRLIYRLERAG